MELQEYISQLLFHHDCVIVPDFCGFVCNAKPASWDFSKKDQLHPPKNLLSINTHLKHNDGMLIQFVAQEQGSSYADASKQIYASVRRWNRILNEEEKLVLDGIGVIEKDDHHDQWDFTPSSSQNHYCPSFGLKPVMTKKIVRASAKENFIGTRFLRYAAIVIPLAGLLLFGYFFYTNTKSTISNKAGFFYMDGLDKKAVKVYEPSRSNPSLDYMYFFPASSEESYRERVYFFGGPFLPSDDMEDVEKKENLVEEEPSDLKKEYSDILIKKYQVIAGAFAKPRNATKLRARLQKRGLNSQITGKSGKLTLVAFDSFDSRKEALLFLETAKSHNPNAWIRTR